MLRSTEGAWAYAVVFRLAAISWWEVLLVVASILGFSAFGII